MTNKNHYSLLAVVLSTATLVQPIHASEEASSSIALYGGAVAAGACVLGGTAYYLWSLEQARKKHMASIRGELLVLRDKKHRQDYRLAEEHNIDQSNRLEIKERLQQLNYKRLYEGLSPEEDKELKNVFIFHRYLDHKQRRTSLYKQQNLYHSSSYVTLALNDLKKRLISAWNWILSRR